MTNHEWTRMNTNCEKLLLKHEVRITDVRVGVILNFKHAKLEWERIVL